MIAIDWTVAQRVGDLVAGSPGPGDALAESVQPMVQDFTQRVSEYTGLNVSEALPALEMVDRSEWIMANLNSSTRPVMELMSRHLGTEAGQKDRDSRSVRWGQNLGASLMRRRSDLDPSIVRWGQSLTLAKRSVLPLVTGAEVGGLLGALSRRVAGQYDVALLDPLAPPRLILVAPNLVQMAEALNVDKNELVSWVTIHELTHAIQFSGVRWLREHMAQSLTDLIEGMAEGILERSARFGFANLRAAAGRFRERDFFRLMLGEELWPVVDRIQATMTLIEGHAEHVMDAVGEDILPSLPTMRKAMDERRETSGLTWRLFIRAIGLRMKMNQYANGRKFCDAVVKECGPQALTHAWSDPATLPTSAEIKSPGLWLARVYG
jgi:putative hydrolase